MNKRTMFFLLAAVVCLCSPLWAASGIDRVDTFLETAQTALRGVGVVVCAIAFMIAGYKYMYKHATIEESGKVVLGGLLVGGAAEIAAFFLN